MPAPFRLVLALAVPLLAAAGCVSDQQVIAQAQDVHAQLEPQIIDDPVLQEYVQQVGDRIVEAGREMRAAGELGRYEPEPWMFEEVRFHLVASPQTNAFTTGGKHVYLYSKLFESTDSEDAFAAVVAHEYGHILGRHVQDSMNNAMIAQLGAVGLIGGAALAGGEDGRGYQQLAGAAAGAGSALGLSYFSRDNEREADELGFDLYVRAGYDPDKFANFFEAMLANQENVAASGGVMGFLSTHPQLQDRIDQARQYAAGVPDPSRRVGRTEQVVPPARFEELQQLSQQYTEQAAQQAQQPATANANTRALAILDAFPACVGGEADGVENPQ